MNHQTEAAKLIEQVKDYGEVGSESDLNVSLAQAHAILAVAEQLRIGNLIALGDPHHLHDGSVPTATEWMDLEDCPLLPEIAEALGIEQP